MAGVASGRGVTSPKRIAHAFRTLGWVGEVLDEERTVWSMFDQDDVRAFVELGYLLVPGVLDPGVVEDMRAGLEELRQADFGDSREATSPADSHFQGQYVIDALVRHPSLSRLLEPEPVIDTVRSLLGPCVTLYCSSGLVAFPGARRSGTEWHSDHQVVTHPMPPLATEVARVGCIVYLDDIGERMGPTWVVPGSHRWRQLPPWDRNPDLPQVPLTPGAGSVLFFDAALWHRGGEMRDPERARRVLIFMLVAGGRRLRREMWTPPAPGSHHRALLERAETGGDPGLRELLSRRWEG